jgi:hypothetical protein
VAIAKMQNLSSNVRGEHTNERTATTRIKAFQIQNSTQSHTASELCSRTTRGVRAPKPDWMNQKLPAEIKKKGCLFFSPRLN